MRTVFIWAAWLLASAIVPPWTAGAAEPIHRVVAFGDSTTAPRQIEGKALPVYADLLTSEQGIEVMNAGVPGDTTAAARLRFEKDVLRPRRPECHSTPTLPTSGSLSTRRRGTTPGSFL